MYSYILKLFKRLVLVVQELIIPGALEFISRVVVRLVLLNL